MCLRLFTGMLLVSKHNMSLCGNVLQYTMLGLNSALPRIDAAARIISELGLDRGDRVAAVYIFISAQKKL